MKFSDLTRRVEPGDQIHAVALMDESGEIIQVLPLKEPVEIPAKTKPRVDFYISAQIEWHGETR